MSLAKATFQYSIKDAEELLEHFDSLNNQPPLANAEQTSGARHGSYRMGDLCGRPHTRRA